MPLVQSIVDLELISDQPKNVGPAMAIVHDNWQPQKVKEPETEVAVEFAYSRLRAKFVRMLVWMTTRSLLRKLQSYFI
ncbi:hypothetical protein JOF48_000829 [Arthrobacter stackebrandtii]|uniref:Uncharacterized protein n=1 Tax=Arthrobacter stackebrandtii TaxID=272161 RepID=A0ABS4YTA0_9MICC|nr:hypothetical protein [Arthrobacter stackebrandtii]PYG98858.1 hypothetical protein CVV67_18480 [Arthrobacter stackebrandtii]